jgi:hypothetical protein
VMGICPFFTNTNMMRQNVGAGGRDWRMELSRRFGLGYLEVHEVGLLLARVNILNWNIHMAWNLKNSLTAGCTKNIQ